MNKEDIQELADMIEEIKGEIFGCGEWLDDMIKQVEKLISAIGRI